MRLVWGLYFVLATLLFTVITLPRADLAGYYLAQLQKKTGLSLAWDASASTFGFRSAHLQSVVVGSEGAPLLDLNSLDVVFDLSGATFSATRQSGVLMGTWQPHRLTFTGQNFALPDIQGDWISHLSITPTGAVVLPEQNGSGTLEVEATAGKNLTAFGVNGALRGSGDYKLDHGNLSFQTALTGDKVNGRLDLSAAHSGSTYILGGTLDVEVNGRRQTLAISGTPANPSLSLSAVPGQFPR